MKNYAQKNHDSKPRNKDSTSRSTNYPHIPFATEIISYFPDPIIVLDQNLQIQFTNAACKKIFKITDNNLFDIPHLKKIILDVVGKKIGIKTVEITHTFPSVGRKTMLVRAQRISLALPHQEVIMITLQDITKRKMIDIQKDDFVGFVTHELKTPVTSMHTFIEILKAYSSKKKDKKSQFLISKVFTQMDRLKELLHSFSSVYKMQTDKLILVKERVDMNKLVKELVETFQYISDTHTIIFKGKVTHWCIADKNRINEALTNLVTNAIKYSPDADKVIITVSENETHITVSVQDFGFGIPKDEQEQVFERFFRAKDKKQYNIKGVGLGLYISSRIIKQHKGKLWLTSKVDEGSTFFFSLPMEKELLEK